MKTSSFILPATLLALASVLPGCSKTTTEAGSMAPASRPEVGVVTLQPQSVAITAELPGRTSASLVAEIRPQVSGLIQKRLFVEGSEVKAGDALYQIDPASYQATYDSALADLAKAEAAVPSAQAKVTRYQGLTRQQAVSRQDLDDAKASLEQARAAVLAAKAAVQSARINLNYTTITAPITGRIDKSSLTPGALVTANQSTALTTIRTIDPINVDVTQSATNMLLLREAIDAGRIRMSGKNIKVRLKLEGNRTYAHDGKLEFVESAVGETTGTFTLRAQFPNPERLLLPGMYVRALIEEGVAPNSFLVPQRAVSRNTKGEATALFVKADGKVEERVLDVGQSVGNNWLVTDGIRAGDRVIVEGSQLVRVGQVASVVEVVVDENTGEVRERQGQAGSAPGSQDSPVDGNDDAAGAQGASDAPAAAKTSAGN